MHVALYLAERETGVLVQRRHATRTAIRRLRQCQHPTAILFARAHLPIKRKL